MNIKDLIAKFDEEKEDLKKLDLLGLESKEKDEEEEMEDEEEEGEKEDKEESKEEEDDKEEECDDEEEEEDKSEALSLADTLKQIDRQLSLIQKKAKEDSVYSASANAKLSKIVSKLAEIKLMK